MKFVALVSGGKDSIYSIHLATLEQHHELIACLHLGAPSTDTTNTPPNDGQEVEAEEPEESYMYQSAGSNVVKYQIEQCLNVPCIVYPRKGRSIQTGLLYRTSTTSSNTNDNDEDNDEVEDLYHALVLVKQLYPMIEAVSSGAILSNYQRNRIEQIVCNRLQLHSLSYLWRKSNPQQLLQEMIQNGQISAILIKTASPPGLRPQHHLNRTIQELYPYLLQLQNKYQFQICGEGGEYESFVLNAKLFTKSHFIVDEANRIIDSNNEMIGTLEIVQYHTEPKSPPSPIVPDGVKNKEREASQRSNGIVVSNTMSPTKVVASTISRRRRMYYHPTLLSPPPYHHVPDQHAQPRIRPVNGGFYSISEIICPQPPIQSNDDDTTSILIQKEIHDILQLLQSLLDTIHCTAHDILMVHVYVANISYFSILNEQYRNFFGVILPPSRSTVDIGNIFGSNNDTNQSHVMIDCFVQCGSGIYMREYNYSNNIAGNIESSSVVVSNDTPVNTMYAQAALLNTFTKLRDVLHVQSRSYWAPICVGPYSQTNTLRGCIHFCAGQIGLYPPTMQFQTNVWTDQLYQSWKNLASVLDALDACCLPKNLLSCILFLSDTDFHFDNSTDDDSEWTQLCDICTTQMICNGNVVPGDIDGIIVDPNKTQNDDEYEDEETRIEVEKSHIPAVLDESDVDVLCPILVVSIPKMPVGALCEIEVVAASRRATNALHIQDYTHTNTANRSIPSVEITKPCTERQHKLGWDTGHDFFPRNVPAVPEMKFDMTPNASSGLPQASSDTNMTSPSSHSNDIQIQSAFRCLGSRATSCALVTAHIGPCGRDNTVSESPRVADPLTLVHAMIMALKTESHFDYDNILHIRLYYFNAAIDGWDIRHILQSVIFESFPNTDTRPATTVIPVTDMGIINTSSRSKIDKALATHATNPFLAIQALSIDPIRTEQSVWIHEGRQYT